VSQLAAWLERQQALHPKSIDLSLERVSAVAARLELDRPGCPVVTVGGTNGKGSTVAFLDSLLVAAGKRVGVFTSPHLVRYNERIRVGGEEASDAAIVQAFERIERARGDESLTFFEFNTLAALQVFATSGVDVIVLEVGLGGRLDATNLVSADVAVLCSVGFDHMEWLGHTLEAIGREKAGIFRAGRPAVLGAADMPSTVHAAIADLDARRVQLGCEYRVEPQSANEFLFEHGSLAWRLTRPSLYGAIQLQNAGAALAALSAGGLLGGLDEACAAAAIAGAQVRGRFQVIERECEWILDVAHNAPAAEVLADNLAARPRSGRTLAVCGILADKEVEAITRVVGAHVDAWILAALDGPRSIATEALAERLPPGSQVAVHARSVAEACEFAERMAQPADRILVFGSFHTVGPALEYLRL
jgi:dihydrofolate synthase/folylpolyglutamate synthase